MKEGIRSLTTLERSYIQTFPKDFIFEGNKTEVEQMIGNAVPVNLAKFVAMAINKYIDKPHLYRNLQIEYSDYSIEDRLAYYASEPNNLLKQ